MRGRAGISSTSTRPVPKSPAVSLASLSEAERKAFLGGLSENALAALPWLWSFWAHPGHQLEPEGDWQCWVILGGRGAGKTRAGAEWVRAEVEGPVPQAPGRARRIALVGETIDQVRAVMVEGESGLMAVSPPDRRPELQASRNRLVWPNGAEAALMSAANPEAMRGPQFDGAWSDELAKWKQGRDAWDMLQFCLRLGDRPRQIVTTTPRDNELLVEILGAAGTVVTHAGTAANRANLAADFLGRLEGRFGGTALGRQEIEGELVRGRAGALWTAQLIDAARVRAAPVLDRVVVAVDPPVTSTPGSDECGIVVAGLSRRGEPNDWQVYVLADVSCAGQSPRAWAGIAAEAFRDFEADRLVAEVNQGGDLVETLMRQVDPQISYRAVRAARGKRLRAEPVAALYEQGRVRHVGGFPDLERQMCNFVAGGQDGIKSPDRLDALVWAVTDLVLDDAHPPAPRVRKLWTAR
jgi:phage terminase large subunit-like protein